jgi:hypothetical protein
LQLVVDWLTKTGAFRKFAHQACMHILRALPDYPLSAGLAYLEEHRLEQQRVGVRDHPTSLWAGHRSDGKALLVQVDINEASHPPYSGMRAWKRGDENNKAVLQ